MMTLTLSFKNKGMRNLMNSMDYVFIGFHVVMFCWAVYLFLFKTNSCSDMWDFWVGIYIIFGLIFMFAFFCIMFLGWYRKFQKRKYLEKNPDHDDVLHDHYNYGPL